MVQLPGTPCLEIPPARLLRGLRLPGGYETPDPVTDAERRRELPGHHPFIVPPTAAKSGFYSDPLLRQIWEQGASALRGCARAGLMGYSLPLTDLVTRGLFQDNLRSGFVVDVADAHPRSAELGTRRGSLSASWSSATTRATSMRVPGASPTWSTLS